MKARSRSVKAVRRSLMYLPIFAWCTNDNEVSDVFADTVIIIELLTGGHIHNHKCLLLEPGVPIQVRKFLTLFIGWLLPSPLGFHGDCMRRRRVSDLVQPTLGRGKAGRQRQALICLNIPLSVLQRGGGGRHAPHLESAATDSAGRPTSAKRKARRALAAGPFEKRLLSASWCPCRSGNAVFKPRLHCLIRFLKKIEEPGRL
jgi:hypothetical protein